MPNDPRVKMLDEVVPDLEILRVQDLVRVDGSNNNALCNFSTPDVAVNTFEGIKAPELANL